MDETSATLLDANNQFTHPATPRFIEPPTYNPSTDCPTVFLKKYDRAGNCNRWNDICRISYLEQYLEGSAVGWFEAYRNNPSNLDKNWETIKTDFRAEFMEGSQQSLYLKQFQQKTQGSNETIRHYYYELLNLANEADPQMPFEEFRKQFEKGLHISYCQSYHLLSEPNMNQERMKGLIQKINNAHESVLARQLAVMDIQDTTYRPPFTHYPSYNPERRYYNEPRRDYYRSNNYTQNGNYRRRPFREDWNRRDNREDTRRLNNNNPRNNQGDSRPPLPNTRSRDGKPRCQDSKHRRYNARWTKYYNPANTKKSSYQPQPPLRTRNPYSSSKKTHPLPCQGEYSCLNLK
ncbi:hypothetical protein ABEB36_010825 [Hypothenemus hampei]|uniref:Retrotransposon gag domain-containing protein n=1 Tax=Hypothenemus hampei TaxID=57062 RepID=A0ABD1ED92_HYPHA